MKRRTTHTKTLFAFDVYAVRWRKKKYKLACERIAKMPVQNKHQTVMCSEIN